VVRGASEFHGLSEHRGRDHDVGPVGPDDLVRRDRSKPRLDARDARRDVVVAAGKRSGRLGVRAERVQDSTARSPVRLKVEEERAIDGQVRAAKSRDPFLRHALAREHAGGRPGKRPRDRFDAGIEGRGKQDHPIEPPLCHRERVGHDLVVGSAPGAAAGENGRSTASARKLRQRPLDESAGTEKISRPGGDERVAGVSDAGKERRLLDRSDRVEKTPAAVFDELSVVRRRERRGHRKRRDGPWRARRNSNPQPSDP
jgi:hypothetical protein